MGDPDGTTVDESLVCAICGTTSRADAAARTNWTWDYAQGRGQWMCPTCARQNLRSIEAKVQQDWW